MSVMLFLLHTSFLSLANPGIIVLCYGRYLVHTPVRENSLIQKLELKCTDRVRYAL